MSEDPPPEYDRIWHHRTHLQEQKGKRLRILTTGALNSAYVEFADGERHIVSRFAYRRANRGA